MGRVWKSELFGTNYFFAWFYNSTKLPELRIRKHKPRYMSRKVTKTKRC